MSYNHFSSLRTKTAHKHDQNTYLDLFVCNCPIKHILCFSISGLWSQWEFAGWEMLCFQASGNSDVSNVQRGKKRKESGALPKCCTIKREEVGFHVPKASKGFSSAEECGCNHHTHLRRDSSSLSTTHSLFVSFCFYFSVTSSALWLL